VSFSNARAERRSSERRSGQERRGHERRVIVDRRYAGDRRSAAALRFDIETPIEHIRNAMQMLTEVADAKEAAASSLLTGRVEAALERLTRALSALEKEKRR
jgi:hypothetical protein